MSMTYIKIIFSVLLTACLVGSAGASEASAENESPYPMQIANESAKEGLVSFLDEVKEYVLNNGKDEALEAFSDPSGEFVRGELYVFAYDFNGTLLAHPHLPKLVGRNNLDLVDPNGVPMIRNLMKVAERGGGFLYNVYPNPAAENAEELKLVRVLKVDDGLWIGSGIYLSVQPPRFSPQDQEALKSFVDEALNYSIENGREKSLEAFNDPAGEFVREDLYIFAYDFNGIVLALPFQPEIVGENRIGVEDANGVAFIQDFISLARGGGGESYYLYPNPAENMTEGLKLSRVAKVDETWWLGAGIYGSRASAESLYEKKPESREELKSFVEEAASHALVLGKEKALADFMDTEGLWVRGDVYIFAHDFNGTALALPFLPLEVGTYRLDVQDERGVCIDQEMRSIVLNEGSGFYEYRWNNPVTNKTEPKVSYVTKVDDTWWIGAGIYQP
jgi:signal transduction histidine kinase